MVGIAALQATHHLRPGAQVVITGQLAMSSSGKLFVQGKQLQLVASGAMDH